MRPFVLALLLLLPLAAATSHDPDQGEAPEANIEDEPGVTYGIFLLVLTLAIGGLLAYVTTRRGSRSRGGGWRDRR